MKSFLSKFHRNHPGRFLWYKLFSPKLKLSKIDIAPCYFFFKQTFPFLEYKTTLFETPINESFNGVAGSGELEYIIRYNKGVLIEPAYGFALDDKGAIIIRSLPYGEVSLNLLPHYIYYKKKKIRHLKRAVSIHYNWFNYWHFYNDTIGQLYLLEKENFDKSIPIIIPEKALQLEYVSFFLGTEYAKKWNWVFQREDEFIKVEEVFFCKTTPNIAPQFIFAREIFQQKLSFNTHAARKIFLKRDPSRGRFISNFSSIEPVLEKYGIEIVDAENLSMEDQIILFSEAALIIGPHGAGLTNMLYRSSTKCSIIEIFPEGFIPVHYYWLAKELNFDYTAFLGSKLVNGGFEIEINKLISSLENTLAGE